MIKVIFFISLLIFSGCSVKKLEKTSKLVVLKTKNIRFSDLGYIGKDTNSVEIDLYIVGKAFKKISIDGMVCIEGEGCMRKSTFNEDYLHGSYPEDLLKNVFLAKPIYDGRNLYKLDDGFMQEIFDKDVDIVYMVSGDGVYFKDKTNRIFIKIKDVK